MKKFKILILLLSLILVSCDKEQLIVVNGIVSGYIKDNDSGEIITDAEISYKIKDETISILSDSTGYFYMTGLPIGSTIIKISKEGYASYHQEAWIENYTSSATIKDGGTVDYYESFSIKLPKLSCSLKGIVRKNIGPTNELRPAANVLITLMMNDSYYYSPSLFTTTTNSKGEYSFSELPNVGYYYFSAGPFSDSDNIYSYTTGFNLIPNTQKEMNIDLNRQDKGIYLVSTSLDGSNGFYTTTYPVGNTITLTFNQIVSPEQTLKKGNITLSGFTLNMETDITYNSSVITITTPTDLVAATSYTLDFSVYSNTEGDYITKSITFTTAE